MRLKLRSRPFKIITGCTTDGRKFKQIKVFSTVLLQFYKDRCKTFGISEPCFFPSRKYNKYAKEKGLAFYLKVNRDAAYTLNCLHRWMAIAERMNAAVIIVCDNPRLERKIYRHTWVKDPNLQFITSVKTPFMGFINNIAAKHWHNAACAHLTTLFHARQSGFTRFWNIDADDTLFLCSDEAVVSLLEQAQNYAEVNDIHLFSLDMWKSRTYGKHWSWGITYCRTNLDVLSIISSEKNADWISFYLDSIEPNNYNSDWHINSLQRRNSPVRIGVFYPINTGFIHWGDLLFNPIGSYICRWTDKQTIEYPFMNAMGVKELAVLPIDSDCVGFTVPTTKDDFTRYYINHGTWLRYSSPIVAKFYKLDKIEYLDFINK